MVDGDDNGDVSGGCKNFDNIQNLLISFLLSHAASLMHANNLFFQILSTHTELIMYEMTSNCTSLYIYLKKLTHHMILRWLFWR